MRIGIHSFYEEYNQNNAMFESSAYAIGENMEYALVLLKTELAKQGHTIEIVTSSRTGHYDAVVFLDFPISQKFLSEMRSQSQKMILIIFESDLVRPENWKVENHVLFDKVLTWSPRFDNLPGFVAKYVKVKWPNKVPDHFTIENQNRNKLSCIISGNKINCDKSELYSSRIEIINWFEKNRPDDFDLYGMGWETGIPLQKLYLSRFTVLKRIARKLHHLKVFGTKIPKSYRGRIKLKKIVLEKYKFSFCYENGFGIEGYVTEKIFDCFFAGCVPVYLGAPDISKYVPVDCFIDARQFSSVAGMYAHISKMSSDVYEKYQKNIRKFILEDRIGEFNAEKFVQKIIVNLDSVDKI